MLNASENPTHDTGLQSNPESVPLSSTLQGSPQASRSSSCNDKSVQLDEGQEQESALDESGEPGYDDQEYSADFLVPEPHFFLTKFTLYETKLAFYLVGSNSLETRFRVLIIGFEKELTLSEPYGDLSRAQILTLLDNLEKDARHNHDFVAKRQQAWGVIGCIRFTSVYYLCLVTKCSPVALIGGNYVFHVDQTKLIPIAAKSTYREPDRRSDEARLMGIFNSIELSQTFYFCHSYELTQTLQTNMIQGKLGEPCPRNEMFIWNGHLLQPVLAELGSAALHWCLPLVHGFIAQSRISVFGSSVFVTVIARRSHYFAGARYLKRGISNDGHVANEVETEQIVSNELSSSLHHPRNGDFGNPRFTSYVQHRGSISVKWSQQASNISPKPPICLDGVDPFYASAAKHFNNLMGRYGGPIRVLNLIKQHEARPREGILGEEFQNCICYLNKFLPANKKIHYTAWDMSRASKQQPARVISYLEKYAKQSLEATGFFHNGASISETKLQNSIVRTNCIDCLDRTNAAQSVIAKCAFGVQLKALGVIDDPEVSYDTDAVELLTAMWRDHGDTLAMQYGGSNLVNTMETYRQVNQWRSHSRDLIQSIRRFYTNSFVDSQRQDAINLFLGNYQIDDHKGMNLWDMTTDYYLHNIPCTLTTPYSYREWYSKANLDDNSTRLARGSLTEGLVGPKDLELPGLNLYLEHHWTQLYRASVLSSLSKLFLMSLDSAPVSSSAKVNESPFVEHFDREKPLAPARQLTDLDPQSALSMETADHTLADQDDHSKIYYENYIDSDHLDLNSPNVDYYKLLTMPDIHNGSYPEMELYWQSSVESLQTDIEIQNLKQQYEELSNPEFLLAA